jgi:hypothetical protein
VFDATLTDIEFNKDFVNKQSDWFKAARPAEPDLEIDGLDRSLLSRILALIGRG